MHLLSDWCPLKVWSGRTYRPSPLPPQTSPQLDPHHHHHPCGFHALWPCSCSTSTPTSTIDKGWSLGVDGFNAGVKPLFRDFALELEQRNDGHGEMEWQRRLDPMNHVPWLPKETTVVFDTLPYHFQDPHQRMCPLQNTQWEVRLCCCEVNGGGYHARVHPCTPFYTVRTPVHTLAHHPRPAHTLSHLPHIPPPPTRNEGVDGLYPPHYSGTELRVGDGHYPEANNFICPPSLAGQAAGTALTNEQAQVAGIIQLVRAPVEPVSASSSYIPCSRREGSSGMATTSSRCGTRPWHTCEHATCVHHP
jgi:hypothetical protein